MERPTDLSDIIDDIITELNIPDQHKEDAAQEGHLAFLENRDIKAAIRYWWDTERTFLITHYT